MPGHLSAAMTNPTLLQGPEALSVVFDRDSHYDAQHHTHYGAHHGTLNPESSYRQAYLVELLFCWAQITASVNNVAIRLDALRELLPSSLGDVPLRSQLAGLGILSEVHVLYTRLEIHNQELEVTPYAVTSAGALRPDGNSTRNPSPDALCCL